MVPQVAAASGTVAVGSRPAPGSGRGWDSGTLPRVRRPGSIVAAALVTAAVAVAVAGSARAQSLASITIAPAEADPGATVIVANGSSWPCTPPSGTASPSASVDLYAEGSATPANRVPFQGPVAASGSWSVALELAPDLPPGRYRVQAGCYTDSGLNSGFGPAYAAGRLEVRLQTLGPPRASSRVGRPGDSVQITSGEAGCTPPAGALRPRVRVSLLDRDGATRAESEGVVDAVTGRWSLPLKVPAIEAQDTRITAVCLARVGASSPYARYGATELVVEPVPADPPRTPPTSVGPTPAPSSTVPGPGGSAPTSTPAQVEATSLPETPVATAIIAEPTYTG